MEVHSNSVLMIRQVGAMPQTGAIEDASARLPSSPPSSSGSWVTQQEGLA